MSAGGWRTWSPGVRVVVRRLRDDLPEPHPEHPDLHVPQHTDVLGELHRASTTTASWCAPGAATCGCPPPTSS